jgi:putative ABC transport system ATP-binding protein
VTVLISLKGVTRTYMAGEIEVPVLRGIDLTIFRGEQVVIMGRSGSGKSTLMNILGCLDRPTTGVYELDGIPVSELNDDSLSAVRGRSIGFVFQAFHLLRGRNILKNVELPMEYQDIGPAEMRSRATHLLERVGLGHRLSHHPNQLSGGERQRVAIARALVNRPRVLLADEPTGNLDSAARGQILALFSALQKESGLTTIMVTHDPEIGQVAGRLIELADGVVVAS